MDDSTIPVEQQDLNIFCRIVNPENHTNNKLRYCCESQDCQKSSPLICEKCCFGHHKCQIKLIKESKHFLEFLQFKFSYDELKKKVEQYSKESGVDLIKILGQFKQKIIESYSYANEQEKEEIQRLLFDAKLEQYTYQNLNSIFLMLRRRSISEFQSVNSKRLLAGINYVIEKIVKKDPELPLEEKLGSSMKRLTLSKESITDETKKRLQYYGIEEDQLIPTSAQSEDLTQDQLVDIFNFEAKPVINDQPTLEDKKIEEQKPQQQRPQLQQQQQQKPQQQGNVPIIIQTIPQPHLNSKQIPILKQPNSNNSIPLTIGVNGLRQPQFVQVNNLQINGVPQLRPIQIQIPSIQCSQPP